MKKLLLAAVFTVTANMGMAEQDAGTAIFAGGCFWCMEEAFEKVDGVESAVSGYIGGDVANPSYEAVTSGKTGHTEAIRVEYDPSVVSYAELLDVFWVNIDPTTPNQQFCDRGNQYRSGIFYLDANQQALAESSFEALEKDRPFDEPIVTELVEAGPFYEAETYHQDYYKKNPLRYRFYKFNCGRAQRLESLWGPPKES